MNETLTESQEAVVEETFKELGIDWDKSSVGSDSTSETDDQNNGGKSDKGEQKDSHSEADKKDKDSGDKGSSTGDKADDTQKESSKVRSKDRTDKSEADGDKGSDSKGNQDKQSEGDKSSGEGSKGSDKKEREEDSKGDDKPSLSEKTNRRIRDLVAKNKEAESKFNELQRQYNEAIRAQEFNKGRNPILDQDYTIDDFKVMQDKDGNVYELTPEQAELQYLKWQGAKRDAQYAEDIRRLEYTENARRADEEAEALIKRSSDAMDSLMDFVNNNPELDSDSELYDPELSALISPVVASLMVTNQENQLVDLKIQPKELFAAINKIVDYKIGKQGNGNSRLLTKNRGNEEKLNLSDEDRQYVEGLKELNISTDGIII